MTKKNKQKNDVLSFLKSIWEEIDLKPKNNNWNYKNVKIEDFIIPIWEEAEHLEVLNLFELPLEHTWIPKWTFVSKNNIVDLVDEYVNYDYLFFRIMLQQVSKLWSKKMTDYVFENVFGIKKEISSCINLSTKEDLVVFNELFNEENILPIWFSPVVLKYKEKTKSLSFSCWLKRNFGKGKWEARRFIFLYSTNWEDFRIISLKLLVDLNKEWDGRLIPEFELLGYESVNYDWINLFAE